MGRAVINQSMKGDHVTSTSQAGRSWRDLLAAITLAASVAITALVASSMVGSRSADAASTGCTSVWVTAPEGQRRSVCDCPYTYELGWLYPFGRSSWVVRADIA